MSQSKSSRREALRAQQEAEARAAKRKKLLGVIAGLVVIAVAVVAVVVGIDRHRSSQQAQQATGAQVTPPNADPKTGIITVNADTAKSGVPTLTIYQDYQCPNCKNAEDTYGPSIKALAASGDIKLQYWTLTFLDTNFRNDASYRASMAAAAAAMVGKYSDYHDTIYKNQPAEEGDGYTDEQLRNTFAADAGITGENLTKFQKYYDTKATSAFAKNSAAKGLAEGSKLEDQFGTPFFTVNGKPYTGWQSITNPTAASLLASITSAAG